MVSVLYSFAFTDNNILYDEFTHFLSDEVLLEVNDVKFSEGTGQLESLNHLNNSLFHSNGDFSLIIISAVILEI